MHKKERKLAFVPVPPLATQTTGEWELISSLEQRSQGAETVYSWVWFEVRSSGLKLGVWFEIRSSGLNLDLV